MKLSDTVESIREVILQKLPEMDLDWKEEDNLDDGKRKFSCAIEEMFQITVNESKVELSLLGEATSGFTEDIKVLEQAPDKVTGKITRSMLYGRLCERFDSNSEITYYQRVLNSLLEKERLDEERMTRMEEEAEPNEIKFINE